MNISVIGLFIFLALASGCAAIVLTIRGLCRLLGRSKRAAPGEARPVRLRRRLRIDADGPPRGPISAFDRWFLNLIRETGLPITAAEAGLMLVFCGVVVGSAMFIWNEHPVTAMVGIPYRMPISTNLVRL